MVSDSDRYSYYTWSHAYVRRVGVLQSPPTTTQKINTNRRRRDRLETNSSFEFAVSSMALTMKVYGLR